MHRIEPTHHHRPRATLAAMWLLLICLGLNVGLADAHWHEHLDDHCTLCIQLGHGWLDTATPVQIVGTVAATFEKPSSATTTATAHRSLYRSRAPPALV